MQGDSKILMKYNTYVFYYVMLYLNNCLCMIYILCYYIKLKITLLF